MKFSSVIHLLVALIFLAMATSARGQEIRNVTVGWGDALRLGRWTPVFVTVEDSQVREIDLQIHGSYGEKSEALWLHQTAVAEPNPVTYSLLFPVNAQPSRIEVIVSDRQANGTTGQTLDTRVLQNNGAFSPGGSLPMRLMGPNDLLIGISGRIDDALPLEGQIKYAGASAGVLDVLRLPGNFAGYDGVSVLILDAPDFDQMKPDQEQAILQWVGRGGNLLVIPPATAIPNDDPLIDALPCAIGVNRVVTLPGNSPATRPAALNGRELSGRPGSASFEILGQTGYLRWLGLGKIAVVPENVSPLQFVTASSANDFWKAILKPMVNVPTISTPTSMVVSDVDETLVAGPNAADSVGRGPRESVAIRHVLEMMGAAETSSRINWQGFLLGLAGFCFLLGPVDSVLLMRLGQRPRNWLTLLGWLGLIGSVVTMVIARPAKSEPEVATFRLLDQVDDSVVGASDIIALNSRHPETVPLSLDKNEWWEPANQAARLFSADRFVDANCREDKTGCRPEWVRLNGSEAQAWHGEVAGLGAGLLGAELQLKIGADKVVHLVGKLTNKSSSAMTDIHIATSEGNCGVGQSLAAGGSIEIDQVLTSDPIAFANLAGDIADVSPERADRMDELVKSGRACVFCQMADARDLKVGLDAEVHRQILRAVVGISK